MEQTHGEYGHVKMKGTVSLNLQVRGHKESDRPEQLNNNEIQYDLIITCSPFKDPINKYGHIHRFGART